ncbi:hypothetical protein EYC84_003696 [Monilinia fructicola]|uniref:Uncharacterized protein n=1 Tax=Monilinia fructicola TaxID=38448 RepID=A0A5M9JUJ1_MONFR|nr:hypothetical protein EYC84_003696 [Monilinia fructicola]
MKAPPRNKNATHLSPPHNHHPTAAGKFHAWKVGRGPKGKKVELESSSAQNINTKPVIPRTAQMEDAAYAIRRMPTCCCPGLIGNALISAARDFGTGDLVWVCHSHLHVSTISMLPRSSSPALTLNQALHVRIQSIG